MALFPPDQRILILPLAPGHPIAAVGSDEVEVASPAEAVIFT